jgi:predicted dehydrogenase
MGNPTPGKPLSVGFIGGSLRSAVGYTHFAACRLDDRWSVDAGCFSTDADINHQSARRYGVSKDRVYGTWRELVQHEKDRLDAVLILTPIPSHHESVVACLDAGLPVICEKTLATSKNEVRDIIEALARNRGFLALTYNYSGYPMVRELRRKIRQGELGQILHFQAEMPQEGYVRVDNQGNKPSPQQWRLKDLAIPIVYLDLGSHLHQLVFHLTGQKPLEVVGEHARDGWFRETVDNVICLARYSENVQGQFWFGKAALGHRNGLRLRIYGSKASAEWCQMNPEELLLGHIDGRREILDRASTVELANQTRFNRFKAGHPAGFVEAFANVYVDIADCLGQYKEKGKWTSEDVYGPEFALENISFLNAIADSVAAHEWQKV